MYVILNLASALGMCRSGIISHELFTKSNKSLSFNSICVKLLVKHTLDEGRHHCECLFDLVRYWDRTLKDACKHLDFVRAFRACAIQLRTADERFILNEAVLRIEGNDRLVGRRNMYNFPLPNAADVSLQ